MDTSRLVKVRLFVCVLGLVSPATICAADEPLQRIFRDLAWAETQEDVWVQAAEGQSTGGPNYSSEKEETKDFDGFFAPAKDGAGLWVFSDDGVDVYVTDYTLPTPQRECGLERKGQPQHLPSWKKQSLRQVKLPFPLRANNVYRVEVKYSNIIYLTDKIDIDGCTLFATNGGGEVVGVDLDIDGMTEPRENDRGGLVVMRSDGNNAPRKKIILQWMDDVTLTWPTEKVKMFATAEGDTEIALNGTDNRFRFTDLPKALYVQGDAPSETMRDVTLTLTRGADGASSTVTFTVLWVEPVDLRFAGPLAEDNDKRDNCRACTEANTYQMGLQKFNATYDGFPTLGWALEARGSIAPAAFDYPNTDLTLGRDCEARGWNEDGQEIAGSKDFSPTSTIPPGNDTGPAYMRDDNPLDSDDLKAIYNSDAPRIRRIDRPVNAIFRLRHNFKVFAQITVDDVPVRASPIREYFVCFSIKQLDAPNGNNWIVIDPPDVQNDKDAGYGRIEVTWDLK